MAAGESRRQPPRPYSRLEAPRPESKRHRHIHGLDGIRAVGVIGVLLYHAGVSWIPGGLLGVDVFFVLSGFLITSLLLDEKQRTGRIALGSFWLRRLRRLAPALILMILVVSAVWGLILKTDVYSLRRDSLFALGYCANWWFAFSGQGYFQSLAAPSPLLHTWSLAVEEQFYLLWPLAVVALVRRSRSVARWALGGAALAAVATLIQSLAGVWTDRLYYGTDTRCIPLLVGAACGAWYSSHRDIKLSPPLQGLLQGAGLLAAIGVGWAFCTVSGTSTGLYRGGFLLLAGAVSTTILAVALNPKGPLTRVLSIPALSYLGRISYGLYLWHWPTFLVIDHARTGLSGFGLLTVRLLASLAIAVVSYRYVESPIREGRLRLPWARLTTPVALATVVVLVVAATPSVASTASISVVAKAKIPAKAQIGSPQSRAAAVGNTRVLFEGDSLALTLGNAMAFSETAYKIHIDNAGSLGCGITRDNRRLAGQFNAPPAACLNWPAVRASQVSLDQPDLVAFLVGRWELTDQFHDGQWRSLGDPDLDDYLATELDRAIETLSSTGATVALLTVPCLSEPEQPNGQPYPEADPARVTRFNQLLVAAQKRHPQQSRIVDLNAMVCPGGKYTSYLQGTLIRTSDGVHFPDQAIAPVASLLLPELRKLSVQSHLAKTPTTPAPKPVVTPTH